MSVNVGQETTKTAIFIKTSLYGTCQVKMVRSGLEQESAKVCHVSILVETNLIAFVQHQLDFTVAHKQCLGLF